MAEYIEREWVISAIMRDCPELVYYNKKEAIWCIECIPAADVAPVVHARWEMKSEDTTPGIYHVKKAFCTRCGKSNKQDRPPYCPNCGAKMDEEE